MSEAYATKKGRVQGRTMVVQRTAPGAHRVSMGMGGGGGGMIQSRTTRMSFGAPMISTEGMSANAVSTVNSVIDTRDKEKKDLTGLNDRLASYLEKVAMMEAQNKMLMAEIERLKKLKGFDAKGLREMYENELQCARDELKKAVDDKNEVEVRLLTAEDRLEVKDREMDALKKSLAELRGKIDKLNAECADYEAECTALRRNAESYEGDVKRLNDIIDALKDDLERTQNDLQNETLERLKAMNEAQSNEERLEFDCDALQEENRMLREMLDQDNMPKMKAQIQGQFKEAMNALRDENARQIDRIKADYQLQYETKVQQMQSGIQRDNMDASIAKETSKKLKSQLGNNNNKLADLNAEIARLRAENTDMRTDLGDMSREFDEEKKCCAEDKGKLRANIECLELELERLHGRNLDLDLEIKMYSRLLDGKEGSLRNIVEQSAGAQTRGGAALSGLILEGGGGGFGGSQQQSNMSSESMGTLRVQRQSNCPIHFTEHETDGSCVKIANTTKGKSMQLKGWKIEREFRRGGKGYTSVYTFGDYMLNGGQTLSVWGKNFKSYAREGEQYLVGGNECETWGSGDGCFTLFDETKKERASCKISFK